MSGYLGVIRKDSKIFIESLRDDMKARKDKDFFWPTGMQVYCGWQGSGKTISAVKHVMEINAMYPKAIIVSNVILNEMTARTFRNLFQLKEILRDLNPTEEYILTTSIEDLSIALVNVNNEKLGVIYLIDEIHIFFNSLESKNIPMFVFAEISQQRKQRKLIIGASQIFLRMAKPFREQAENLIVCKTYFGLITTQRAYDGHTIEQDYDGKITGVHKKSGWFFQNRKRRGLYDTYQKVVSSAEQYDQAMRVEIKTKK